MIHYLHRKLFKIVSYLNRLSVANPEKPIERIEPNRIYSLAHLRVAALNRRSVIWQEGVCRCGPKPAAWVLNMSANQVDHIIKDGLYLYMKPQPMPF